MDTVTLGSVHCLKLDSLAIGGEGVGRLNEMVVFVPYGAPGDEVEIHISEIKKNYARGEITRVIKSSAHRVTPPCPIYYKCGGCQLQHLTYGAQILYKRRMVEETLSHIAGIKDVRVDDVVEASAPWHYRNKMQVVAASKPFKPPSTKVAPYFGLYAKQTHQVIKMEECAIQSVLSNKILKVIKEAIARLNWEVFNEKTGKGILRYVITRSSFANNQLLLILVTTDTKIPGIAEFVNFVTKKVPELQGIVINKNDKKTNAVLGSQNKLIWGDDYLIEEIEGLKYKVSAESFFQVNPPQLAKMLHILDQFLEPSPNETLLDAYCGMGAIALWMAKKFRKVIGIEEVPQARKDALESAALNGIGNFEIHTGLVEKVLPAIYHDGTKINKAVLDPPRKGCDEKVLELITKMRIRQLVYVSCNPATLARDLVILKAKDYRIERVVPLDMFPQTFHVETIVKLVYDPPSIIKKAAKAQNDESSEKKPQAKTVETAETIAEGAPFSVKIEMPAETVKKLKEEKNEPAQATTVQTIASEPDKEKAETPIKEKAAKPTGDKVSAPVKEKTAKPAGDKASVPVKEKAAKPVGDKVSAPVKEKAAKPVGDKVSAPVKEKTAKPIGDKASTPVKKKTDTPAREKTVEAKPKGKPSLKEKPFHKHETRHKRQTSKPAKSQGKSGERKKTDDSRRNVKSKRIGNARKKKSE